MRRATWLVGVFLLFSAAAQAQGQTGSETPSGPTTGTGSSTVSRGGRGSGPLFGAGAYDPWQVSIGFQYDRENLRGVPFNTYGGNVSLVRYFGRWFGAEAQIGAGFGNTHNGSVPPNLDARSLFGGGGARLAYRNQSRFEPWIHGIVGAQYFHFYQSSQSQGSMTALAGFGGGGVDFYMRPHVAIRTEADVVGSRFFSTNQRSFQAILGVAIDF